MGKQKRIWKREIELQGEGIGNKYERGKRESGKEDLEEK